MCGTQYKIPKLVKQQENITYTEGKKSQLKPIQNKHRIK